MLVRSMILALIGSCGLAAVPKLEVKPKQPTRFLTSGVIIGGEYQDRLGLEDLRRQSRSGIERWVLSFRDRQGQPLQERLGYFHVDVDGRGQRVVLAMPQVLTSELSPELLKRKVQGSKLIESADLIYDPADRIMSMVIRFRQPVQVRAKELPHRGSRSARLLLDFQKLK